jgi:hypothetical protein
MTRNTFITWALSKALAEYCGTSVQMIEQSYGKYIARTSSGLLSLLVQRPWERQRLVKKPTPNRAPLRVLGKRPQFPIEFWWRRGN